MNKLTNISEDELQEWLHAVEDPKAVMRLMVALAYKDGVDVETLSERYGFPQSTIYYWFGRIEKESLDDALIDDPRPGRPPKLTSEQRATVEEWLAGSPREIGIAADDWSPELLRQVISEEYEVEYSLGHIRRLLRNRS